MFQSTMSSAFICFLLLLGLSSMIPEATCAKAVTNLTDVFLKHGLHYLNAPKTGTFTVYDIFDCTFECLQIPSCLSLNLAVNKGADGKLLCELLSTDIYRSYTEFKGNESSHHFSIKSPCSSWPCKNGGTCVPNYEDGSFKCLCQPGYIREYCQTAARSCKEHYDVYNYNTSRLVALRFGQTSTSVLCHFGDFGCGDGSWTPVMKIDGSQSTFHYDSTYWSDGNEYNLLGGETGFDSQETKLPTYLNTPFSTICLGMKEDQEIKFITINTEADSLYSLIADGQYRATSLARDTWKSLISSGGSLQVNCNKEGFNAACSNSGSGKARIGYAANENNDCYSCDSRLGFGTGGAPDNSNTCGNAARWYPDNGDKFIKGMGYILIQ